MNNFKKKKTTITYYNEILNVFFELMSILNSPFSIAKYNVKHSTTNSII